MCLPICFLHVVGVCLFACISIARLSVYLLLTRFSVCLLVCGLSVCFSVSIPRPYVCGFKKVYPQCCLILFVFAGSKKCTREIAWWRPLSMSVGTQKDTHEIACGYYIRGLWVLKKIPKQCCAMHAERSRSISSKPTIDNVDSVLPLRRFLSSSTLLRLGITSELVLHSA